MADTAGQRKFDLCADVNMDTHTNMCVKHTEKHRESGSRSFLGKQVTVSIDRPLGSRHPVWNFIYPVNYGYLPGQPAPDGEEQDAYVLGVFEPVETFTGTCIAVIHRLNDQDDKLVVVPPEKNYTDDQITALVEFQEQFFRSILFKYDGGERDRIAGTKADQAS